MSVALLVSRGAFLTLAGVACHLWRCLALLVFYLALFGVACLCWRCFFLAVIMMVGWILFYSSLFHSDVERKVCKCFSLVASLENLASVTGFAGSSCSFLIANALSVHLLARWVGR